MRKPTVYLDTNILSSLYLRGRTTDSLYRRHKTRQWWDEERRSFRLLVSSFTEDELRQGTYHGQKLAIAQARRLPHLPNASAVQDLAHRFVEERLVPTNKFGDSVQLALATHYHIDYLLTWNYAHFANVNVQRKLEKICLAIGIRPPLVVSPETIPKRSLGQDIRRDHETRRQS
jgi:predicted nucleic acid-binding protein